MLQHFSSAVVGGTGRPSVETALHAMLGKFVIHTHPVAANALNCGPGLKALEEITAAGELPPLWVPYTDPGWRLAHTVKSAAEAYRHAHGCLPVVLFMENHGLLVSAPEARSLRGAPCGMGEPVRAVFPASGLSRSVLPRISIPRLCAKPWSRSARVGGK